VATVVVVATGAAGVVTGIQRWSALNRFVPTCADMVRRLAAGVPLTFEQGRALRISDTTAQSNLTYEDKRSALEAAMSLLDAYGSATDAELERWLAEHSMRALSDAEARRDPSAKGLLDRMGSDASEGKPPLFEARRFLFREMPGFNRVTGVLEVQPSTLILGGQSSLGAPNWQRVPPEDQRTWLATSGVGGRLKFCQTLIPPNSDVTVVQIAVNVEFADGFRCPMHFVFARRNRSEPWSLILNSVSNDCDLDHSPLAL
jgi:hypothetical protein